MTDPVVAQTPAKAGLWEDFIDILHQPSVVFERRRDGQFGLALLIFIVISVVLFFALQNGLGPIMDAEISKASAALRKNPQMTPEMISQQIAMMEKFAVVAVVIFVPLIMAITAVLLWIAAKVIDGKIAFAAAMMIVTYSQVPRIIETVINAVQGLLLSPESITSRYSVTLGPGRFLAADANPVVLTVLGGLDLFTIWTMVLMAIGLSVVGRVPIVRAAIAVAAIWALTLLPQLYGAIQQG